MTNYFSDQETGPMPRTSEHITPVVWGGIVSTTMSAIRNGSFGEDFPEICPDGSLISGTDVTAFSRAMLAEIRGIPWPLATERIEFHNFSQSSIPYCPETHSILDFIQFCYHHISHATATSHHSYYKHDHLAFDRAKGRALFLETINRIFSRNGIAFDLQHNGDMLRLAPPLLSNILRHTLPSSGDDQLDRLLEDAQRKFFSPKLKIRRESLEKLWDAWERLKTLHIPDNKRLSTTRLIEDITDSQPIRVLLNNEAQELTNIGNRFTIRHFEVDKEQIVDSTFVDYLFHRMFALLLIFLRSDNLRQPW